MNKAFFVSIPHSGEQVPPETPWLHGLSEPHLMRDVDRFVDVLYAPAFESLGLIPTKTQWHRYVTDLNRLPLDIDEAAVIGAPNPVGKFPIGLHWTKTTQGETLITSPMTQELHKNLVKKYYEPFHQAIRDRYAKMFSEGHKKVYQLDAHSMPSWGTDAHKDPGKERPEIVVSDYHGQSCEEAYKDLVMAAFKKAGFQVAYNFPYVGGRVTQIYGQPQLNQHAIQVEIRRSLYMNEETKQLDSKKAQQVQDKIKVALTEIYNRL
jgi:N-formylglutamate deformylase